MATDSPSQQAKQPAESLGPRQTTPSTEGAPAWAVGAVLALLCLGLLAAVFGSRFLELFQTWQADPSYSHGFLVPLVSGFLAWQVWRSRAWPVQSELGPGLFWLIVGGFLHLVAVIVWIPPIDFAALAAMLHGIAVQVGGRAWARGFRFPILFLFFMFPLPVTFTDWAAVWLQGIVSTLATETLRCFVPAWQQGNYIHLPGVHLQVGDTCSGLRQVIAFAALTLLVAHCSQRSLTHKILLVLSGLPVAIAANLVRVLLMAVVVMQLGPAWIDDNTYIGPAWLGVTCHTAWGLLAMAVGLGLLLIINGFLGPLLPNNAERGTRNAERVSSSAVRSPRSALVAVAICLGLIWAGQWGLQAYLEAGDVGPAPTLRKPLETFPFEDSRVLGAWLGKDLRDSRTPAALPFDVHAVDTLDRMYEMKGNGAPRLACQLWMIHAQDGSDRRHHPLVCYRVAGYVEQKSEREEIKLDNRPAAVERFCFTRNGERSYVYYWHYTFEPPVAPETSALQRIYQQRVRRWPSLTIEVFTNASSPEQREIIEDFVKHVDEVLQEHVPPGARMGSATLPILILGAPRP